MMKGSWVRVIFSLQQHSRSFVLQVSLIGLLLCLLLGLPVGSTVSQGKSDPPCDYASQICGNLRIPYPFGMSTGCGLPENYRISCKLNASYGDGDLAFLRIGTPSTPELQVLEFSTMEIIVNSTELKAMPQDCITASDVYGNASLELHNGGPFIMSDHNWLAVIGCDADGSCQAETTNNFTTTISCSSNCYNQYDMAFCNAYACCIVPIPPRSYAIHLEGRGINYRAFPDVCGFATVLSPSSYSNEENGVFAAGHYGLAIEWALQLLDKGQNCTTAKQRSDYACSDAAICHYDSTIQGYTCNCTAGYRGDGYKHGLGCQDINECEEQPDVCEKPPLGSCTNMNGSYKCSCVRGGNYTGRPGTCPNINHSTNLVLPVLLGGLAGAALLGVIFAFTCISRRAYRKRQEREENFRRIGGDHLKSLLFSEKELIKATNGFSDDHVLGEGGFGRVYWGKLQGATKVAIKRAKPKALEEQIAQMQSFVKEILLLSKTVHKNVVQLLGCCVETSVPLLVYEFVENGTLRDYLSPRSGHALIVRKKMAGSECSMWAWRLHIAMETAEALNYLHTMTEPIFHLDMKSANILIDKKYNPKVADFGLSCFLTSDATHLTNQLPAGTFGYVDPEYYQSLRITDKCDVYSFGVILLELISSRPACQGPGAVLAHHFRTVVDMEHEIVQHLRELPSFVDSRLGNDADVLASILDMAKLANRCVALKGSDRPSMLEVVGELKKMQAKNAGRLIFNGSMYVSPHVSQEWIGANNNESDGAALLKYNRIASNQSASSSTLFATSGILPDQHTPPSTSSHSSNVQLQQYSLEIEAGVPLGKCMRR